jgi:uncharacterized protein
MSAPQWFNDMLDSLHNGDVKAFVDMYADDAVHEFPFAPEGMPERLEGKSAIYEYMKQLPALVKLEAFDILGVREAGDELIVEAQSRGTRPATGAPFEMQYVWFITRKDGRISRFRDYMNPLRFRSGNLV